jgi:hydrogenase expression/formation protein HypC
MPGKVLAVNENIAAVDFSGNIVEAQADLVSVEPGDYVLVHAGFILQKLSQEEGDTLAELFREIESYE